MTYAVDALRGAFIHFNQFDPWMGPAVLVGMAVVFFAIGAARFQQGLSVRWHAGCRSVATSFRFAGVFGLLGAVYLLPPDTALREVRAAGVLRACLPPSYPPLVTGDPAAPGIDVELLQAVAHDLGVRLDRPSNPVMGKDFNPRTWRITRAQCEVLAGGVVGSPTTRSFLDTTPPYAETGWALVAPRSRDAAFKAGASASWSALSGLDRRRAGAWLRAAKAQVTVTLGRRRTGAGSRGWSLRCRDHGTPAGRSSWRRRAAGRVAGCRRS